jgi:hypothetical protein
MKKLGKFQQQVYDDIKKYGKDGVDISTIYYNNAPFYHSALALKGYSSFSRVTQILNKLAEYDLIYFENRGYSDGKVFVKQ